MITLILNKCRINKLVYALIPFFILSNILSARAQTEDSRKAEDLVMQNPFGVLEFMHWNHPWNNFKYSSQKDLLKAIALMKEAGIGFVRFDFLWEDIEPRPGEFDFAKYDNIVALLGKNNINILGILGYSACWASGKWNEPPRDYKLFVNYAAKVIQHYIGKVTYWEIWNEPDSSTYWANQDGLKSYVRLLKEVYLAAKQANPACRILNGGLANGLASVNHLYDNGAKDYFDILNIHYFASPLYRNAIKAVAAYPQLAYKVMRRNGDADKKIWVTEIGCPGVKNAQKVNNWWLGKNSTERQQAEWLEKVFTQLIQSKAVQKIFWAFFRDTKGHWNNGVDYFGLIRWDFSRKPAYFSLQKCFYDWKKSKNK